MIKKIKPILVIIGILTSHSFATTKQESLASYLKKIPHKTKLSSSKRVQEAKKYLGRRYKYGKFDCSKFVQTVVKNTDKKKLPRTTREQIKIGKKIPKAKAKKGDLIFFGDSKHRVGHVGIIIDPKNHLMIHNSSAKGKVVISKYNTKYYTKKYRGVRRI